MTNEQIRIKVAEACGAKWFCNPNAETPHRILVHRSTRVSHWHEFVECDKAIPVALDVFWRGSLPDYPNSLDACHEFEKGLTGEQVGQYDWHLDRIVIRDWDAQNGPLQQSMDWHATALQRCEAFLRTIGQWEEAVTGAKEEGA